MTYLVSKRIKGHDYWYEVRSVRVGGRPKQVHVRYIGKSGKPSAGALRNLGRQQVEVSRKFDPEWAAAWDQPDGWLLFGKNEWSRLVKIGELSARQQKIVRRREKRLQRILHPPDLVQWSDEAVRQASKEEAVYRRHLRQLRHAGKLQEYDRLHLGYVKAYDRHFAQNLRDGMKPMSALKAAYEQTAPERQAMKDFIEAIEEEAKKSRSG